MDNTQFDKMMQGMFQGMAKLQESQAQTDLQMRESQAESRKSQAEFRKSQVEFRKSQVEFRKSMAELRESEAKANSEFREQLRESKAKADLESQKLREFQAETSLQIRESQAKTDLEFQKLQEFQAETGSQIRELRESQAKTDLQIRKSQTKTDSQLQELERKLGNVGEILGNIGINTGCFAEELFSGSFKRNPVLGGTRYDRIECNVLDSNGKTEYDILLFNGSSVAIIEIKYKAHLKDIEDLLEKKAVAFRLSHPECAGHKLYLGLATTISNDELVQKASEAGIYLLGQNGLHVELLCDNVQTF
ncbi:hypothetical protein P0082_08255 [Candidatus Haliotispira prima]|uniref:DUF3782 domain-containing protein n=1 Tax=Candidatus Haliotispira prima TaxID=3034016 RepID=A0ABY8MG13_9SPIO|nr:hypothetical protein P0082_08255 [Candidatus Haliotispira prima]